MLKENDIAVILACAILVARHLPQQPYATTCHLQHVMRAPTSRGLPATSAATRMTTSHLSLQSCPHTGIVLSACHLR